MCSFRSDTRSGAGAHGIPLQGGPPIPLCFFRWKNATESSDEDRGFPFIETRHANIVADTPYFGLAERFVFWRHEYGTLAPCRRHSHRVFPGSD